MLLSERTISELQTKMVFIRKLPQETQTRLFFDMCDFGINLYVETEKERYPNKTRKDIMREYYLSQKTNKRC
jgi:hypothetical protein